MNETANVINEIDLGEVIDVCEDIVESGNGFIGVIASGAVIAAAALGGIAYKKRAAIKNWSNNRKAKKLEKAGYTVVAPELPVEDENDADRETETK